MKNVNAVSPSSPSNGTVEKNNNNPGTNFRDKLQELKNTSIFTFSQNGSNQTSSASSW